MGIHSAARVRLVGRASGKRRPTLDQARRPAPSATTSAECGPHLSPGIRGFREREASPDRRLPAGVSSSFVWLFRSLLRDQDRPRRGERSIGVWVEESRARLRSEASRGGSRKATEAAEAECRMRRRGSRRLHLSEFETGEEGQAGVFTFPARLDDRLALLNPAGLPLTLRRADPACEGACIQAGPHDVDIRLRIRPEAPQMPAHARLSLTH